jgi:hypothetical protein
MKIKLVKYLKLTIAVLYVLYLANIIIYTSFQQIGITNRLIETYGTIGYIISYALGLFLSCGFFVVPTVIQIIIYHANKKKINNCFILLMAFEIIKILGTLFYFYLIDSRNINFTNRPLVSSFIVTYIIFFAIICLTEIIMLICGKYFVRYEEK